MALRAKFSLIFAMMTMTVPVRATLSTMDRLAAESCVSSVQQARTNTCNDSNARGIETAQTNAIRIAIVACESEFARSNTDCSHLSPANEHKKICHPSQFCYPPQSVSDTLKNCGLEALLPFVDIITGIVEVPYAVVSDLVQSTYQCVTRPNCGVQQLSAERRASLEEAHRSYSDWTAQVEAEEERKMCSENSRESGCPLSELSCRQWDQVIQGNTVQVGERSFSANQISSRDGFNKGNFCRRTFERSGRIISEQRNSKTREAAEAIRLWLADFKERHRCFQPRHLAEELCSNLGTAAAIVTGPALLTGAISLAMRGMKAAEIFRELRTPIVTRTSAVASTVERVVEPTARVSTRSLAAVQPDATLSQFTTSTAFRELPVDIQNAVSRAPAPFQYAEDIAAASNTSSSGNPLKSNRPGSRGGRSTEVSRSTTTIQPVETSVPTSNGQAFVIGGSNSTETIQNMRTITGARLEDLDRRARGQSGSFSRDTAGFQSPFDNGVEFRRSMEGWLAPGETMRSRLVADNDIVLSQGLTHQAVARPLLQMEEAVERALAGRIGSPGGDINNTSFEHNGRRYEVEVRTMPGGGDVFSSSTPSAGWRRTGGQVGTTQGSIFNDHLFSNWAFKIRDVRTGEVLRGDALTPQLIHRYGFYQGGPYRMPPESIIRFFNLRPPP